MPRWLAILALVALTACGDDRPDERADATADAGADTAADADPDTAADADPDTAAGTDADVASDPDPDAVDDGADPTVDPDVTVAPEVVDPDPDATSDLVEDHVDAEEVVDTLPDGGDLEAPTLRDVRVAIGGELSSEVDLGRQDVTRVLPEPTTARFRVFATDDETAAADLDVRVVQETTLAEVPGQTREFRNGLWNIDLMIGPGMALRVAVKDEAGNAALSAHRLVLPTQAEALAGAWERRFFAEGQVVTHRWLATFQPDGTWLQSQLDSGVEHGGSWTVSEAGLLHLRETFRNDASGPGDADPETVEWEEVMGLYVDDLYFAAGPFRRDGAGSGLVGTWTRTFFRKEPGDGGVLELVEERTETLFFGDDDTWIERWSGIRYSAEAEEPINQSWGGTYAVELNENYSENIGDFLVRTVTEIDGEPVAAEPDRWDLHRLRLGRLLVGPRLRRVE